MKDTEACAPTSKAQPPTLNLNLAIKALMFGLAVFLSVSIKSAFLSLGIFAFFIIWDKKFIIPSILITPAIETILIATEGVTLTKLLAGVLMIYFVLHAILKKSFSWNKNIRWLMIFLVLTIIGSIIGLYSINPNMVPQAISYNLITVFPKIIFAYLLFNYLIIQGKTFYLESILFTTYTLTIGLIIVLGYFVLYGYLEIDWRLTATRLTMEGADPNEFAGIITALGAFSLYLLYSKNSNYEKVFSIISVGLLIYSVVLTLSRGGILTLLFLFLIFFISFYKQSFKKTILAAILTFLIFGLLLKFDLINVFAVTERFFIGREVETSTLTANRTDIFRAAFNAFLEKPILGYGNSPFTAGIITNKRMGMAYSIHNIYLEIMIRFGIVGLAVFLVLIWNAIKGFIKFFRSPNKKNPEPLFILPIIALLAILFSGLALSWQWRDILWYLIGISMVSTFFINNSIKEGLKTKS